MTDNLTRRMFAEQQAEMLRHVMTKLDQDSLEVLGGPVSEAITAMERMAATPDDCDFHLLQDNASGEVLRVPTITVRIPVPDDYGAESPE